MTDLQRELTGATWRTSSHSGSGDQCVQVASLSSDRHAVRDSKDPLGPSFVLSTAGWRRLLESARES
ncbi:DUF397 domain-containing protein [Actinomadura macrotermitis]|uniref:DUF397 domain-containing protein n=1 Tax=Actinomadura macrotermitis TaxID=2585200 RepID=A0A7K0BYX9_9ACTN|nr:hypothetical protein [Actinomadura macrotermitis]